MYAELFIGKETGFKLAMRIGAWVGDNYRYVQSVMPEGQCADWAEKFWDASYDAIYQQDIAAQEGAR